MQWREADARHIIHRKAALAHGCRHFGGFDEFAPCVGAFGQPAQHIFRADNAQSIGFCGAVKRGEDEQAVGLNKGGNGIVK